MDMIIKNATWACSGTPEDYFRWIWQMLAEQLIELNIVESISHECVRQALKKHYQTLAEADVVQSICLPDGRCARGL